MARSRKAILGRQARSRASADQDDHERTLDHHKEEVLT